MLHYRVTLRIIQAFFCYMLIASSCVSAVQAQVAKAPEQKKDTSTPGNAPSGTPGSPSDQGTTPPAPATAPMPIVPANQGAKTPAEVITSAKAAIQFAQNNIDKANMLVKLLNPNIDAKVDSATLDKLQSCLEAIKSNKSLLEDLTESQKNLKTNMDALNQITDDASKAEKDSLIEAVTSLTSAVTTLGTKDTPGTLKAALENFVDFALKVNKTAQDTLNKTQFLEGDMPDPNTSDVKVEIIEKVRLRMTAHLGELKPLIVFHDRHQKILDVNLLPDGLFKNVATEDNYKNLTKPAYAANLDKIIKERLKFYIETVSKDLDNRSAALRQVTADIQGFKSKVGTALKPITEDNGALSDIETLLASWTPLSVTLRTSTSSDFNMQAETIASAITSLQNQRAQLRLEITRLQGLLAGDLDKFVADQSRLFYFTDVPRLMRALNPTADILNKEAVQQREEAAQARRRLNDMEANLFEQAGKVSDLTTRISQIQAQITQATTASNTAANNLLRAQNIQTQLKNQMAAYQKTHPNPADSTPEKTHTDNLKAQSDAQDMRVMDAVKGKSDADQKRQDLLNEQTGLPAQLKAAQENLSSNQGEVRSLRRKTELAIIDEQEAFLLEKNNAPIWYTTAIADSPDPIQRVFLYGYEDSKIIFIRGLPQDVAFVKEIIAQYDRPAPQAMITFWQLQLNGSNSKAFTQKMQIVRENIGNIQDNTVVFQEALRTAIKNEVNRIQNTVEMAAPDSLLRERMARYFFYTQDLRESLGFVWTQCDDWKKAYARMTAATELRLASEYLDNYLKGTKPPDKKSGDNSKDAANDRITGILFKAYDRSLKRTQIALESIAGEDTTSLKESLNRSAKFREDETYKNLKNYEVSFHEDLDKLQQLSKTFASAVDDTTKAHITNEASNLLSTEFLTRYTLPDPAKATTLGEMLFAISLASRPSRARIYEEFLARLQSQIVNTDAKKGKTKKSPLLADFVQDSIQRFLSPEHRTTSTLGRRPESPVVIFGDLDRDPSPNDAREFSPNQMEILLALRTKARADVAGAIQNLVEKIDEMPRELHYNEGANQLRRNYLPLVGWLTDTASPKKNSQLSVQDWKCIGLRASLGYNSYNFGDDNETHKLDRAVWEIGRVQSELNPLSKATPRVAAADDMIKRMINAVQRDLDAYFIERAIIDIDNAANGGGIQLGSVQRTSLLATNRQVARVDAEATAQAETSTTQDLLASASQLASLATHLQDRNRSSSLASGLLSGGLASTSGAAALPSAGLGLFSLLGALANQDPPQTGELYSINSGNLFRVTPVFDPSGQAVRFQFNFTALTHVREPDGTRNPQIPRIDKHTVDTEVQISNLDLQEISSFQANTQVGRPEKRGGGIPFINLIPGLKDIPLIGYYTRQAPSPAVRQESLLLAQTVVYPTISSIADLLLEATSRPVALRPTPPKMIFQKSELLTANSLTLSNSTVQRDGIVRAIVTLLAPAPEKIDVSLTLPDEFLPNSHKITIEPGNSSGSVSIDLKSALPFGISTGTIQIIASLPSGGQSIQPLTITDSDRRELYYELMVEDPIQLLPTFAANKKAYDDIENVEVSFIDQKDKQWINIIKPSDTNAIQKYQLKAIKDVDQIHNIVINVKYNNTSSNINIKLLPSKTFEVKLDTDANSNTFTGTVTFAKGAPSAASYKISVSRDSDGLIFSPKGSSINLSNQATNYTAIPIFKVEKGQKDYVFTGKFNPDLVQPGDLTIQIRPTNGGDSKKAVDRENKDASLEKNITIPAVTKKVDPKPPIPNADGKPNPVPTTGTKQTDKPSVKQPENTTKKP